ncbi:sensor histidine kinase [Priestia taiwanensis]|nr:HAMP domain-containing sensor histidine kinase [Priestia taiwanensis]MBM7362660.1 signal transduction histidine kinase [Priestia taiwanensis]
MSAERESDFTRVSVGYLEYGIEIEDSEAYIKGEIRESVLAKDGWLQVIDEEGVVIGSVNTPNDVPVSYRFIDLVTLDLENYKTHHWSVKLPSGEQVSVLYGETHKSKRILNVLKNKETFPTITNEDNDYLQQQHAWMHVYNAKGEKIQQFGLTKDATYTFNDILSAEKEPWNSPVQLSTSYIEREELLYVVGIDNIKYSPDDVMDVHIGMNMLKAILVAIMLLILLIASLAFWYGKKFGIPILHIMRWVNNMSEGKLEEPRNKKGKKPLLNKRNVLHKRYRVFKGVLVSLESLGDTLKRNAEEQKKIEKTREEWITGLSHDLKTPLSSIYGYATLLETDAYTWSKEETMEFGHIMKEKSAYMSELIDDLTLTYRLKNNGLPLQKEKREVVSLLRELVKSYCMADNLVQLQCTQEEVFLDIDVKWFTRMMNNLLANAREHNPSDTEITVVVEQRRTSTAILVKDNGVGMDTETIDKLFNRYYRGGTTTDSSDGSGLGMAIAHQLVQAHGGEVQVMSQKGVGTVIKLLFPTNTDTNRNNG